MDCNPQQIASSMGAVIMPALLPTYTQVLAQGQEHKRLLVNVCWMNESVIFPVLIIVVAIID